MEKEDHEVNLDIEQQCFSHEFLVLFGFKLFFMLYIVTRLDLDVGIVLDLQIIILKQRLV